jgi:RimJ/RimL family protein N-acetyltransferase
VLGDVCNWLALNSDDGVMRFLDWHPPGRQDVVAEIEDIIQAYERYPGLGRFAAEDPAGEFVGWFGLRVTVAASPDEVELGYRLRRRFWGQGLATEGSRALVEYAFDRQDVAKVYAETMAVNTASRRVLEKVGLHLVRTFHREWVNPLPGTEFGEVVYELTRADWRRS